MKHLLMCVMLAHVLAACSEASGPDNQQAQPSAQNGRTRNPSEPTTAPVGMSPVVTPGASATPTGEPARINLAAIEQLVRSDLARFLAAAPETVNLVSSEARTWPNAGLGCGLRQGVREPQPTSGYLVVLEHNGQTYRYHSDQRGAFIRCNLPSKPIDPIR